MASSVIAPFIGCKNISTCRVSINNKTYVSIDNMIYTKDYRNLVYSSAKKVDIKIDRRVKTIKDGSITNNDSIQVLEIPKGVEIVEDFAIYECCSLKEIILPNTIKCFAKAVYKCPNLEQIVINIKKKDFDNIKLDLGYYRPNLPKLKGFKLIDGFIDL